MWWIKTGWNDSLEFASWWLQLKGKNKHQWAEVGDDDSQLFKPPIFPSTSGSQHRHKCKHQRALWFKRKYGSLHPPVSHVASVLNKAYWFPFHMKSSCFLSADVEPFLNIWIWSWYSSFGMAEGSNLAEDAHLVGPCSEKILEKFISTALLELMQRKKGSEAPLCCLMN